jgi:D-serine deaminase-like pyridoxal phosphate-dependent protein
MHDLPTPALVVDGAAFEHNVATMGAALPGARLRPHVKAFKSTALARKLADAGHAGFCAATPKEVLGMAGAGLGADLLLANESVDPVRLAALGALVQADTARVTVAVDSEATVAAAAAGGLREVLVDVNVGMPRCGCTPEDAGRVADRARAAGLEVRGVMGYEGHLMNVEDRDERVARVAKAMGRLLGAHALVGGDVVSGGGTGTFDTNEAATEIQAGSFTLMDTAYAKLDLPFQQALALWCTVIHVDAGGWAVCDGGLKSLGMDHGDPAIDGAEVLFCSDEHITFTPGPELRLAVGDKLRVWPAHVDPTVALHERMHVVDADGKVTDQWDVDLRHW